MQKMTWTQKFGEGWQGRPVEDGTVEVGQLRTEEGSECVCRRGGESVHWRRQQREGPYSPSLGLLVNQLASQAVNVSHRDNECSLCRRHCGSASLKAQVIRTVRQDHNLTRPRKKVLESLLDSPDERVILSAESLEFRSPFL
jgi:hypothetical protein